MILRRIGYTRLTLFRSVTQRSDSRRAEPWRVLFERMRDALLLATDELLDGLRRELDHGDRRPPFSAASMSSLG
jgi:protein tyrosine/serine phosphatase